MSFPFTLRQLEYFTAIASEGSLAGAAERCNVSATALAQALDEFEGRLGLQLFLRRKGKGVTLTSAGARLLQHAQKLLNGAETFVAEASQDAKGLRGRLVVGCFSSLAPFFLPALIGQFRQQHHELEFELEEANAAELNELLLQGRLDSALLYGVDVHPQLEFDPLHEYSPYALLPEGHPYAARESVRLADLVAEPLVQIDIQPSQHNVLSFFTSVGLTPDICHTSKNYELVRCLVGQGLGYAVLIQRPVARQTYDGHNVAIVEIEDDLSKIVVGLARPRGAPLTTKYTTLRNFLRTQNRPGWDRTRSSYY